MVQVSQAVENEAAIGLNPGPATSLQRKSRISPSGDIRMNYITEFNDATGICTVHVTGRVKRPEDSMILQQFARDFGYATGCRRFLFDMTGTEIIGGTFDIYQTGSVPVDSDRRQITQQIALVYSSNLADHKFMETVAVNRGYNLRVFDQINKAIEWLTSNSGNIEQTASTDEAT